MRDYLYVWHEPEHQFLVASGIEFKDFVPSLLQGGGVVLIDHQSETASRDDFSSLDFATTSGLSELAAEDIYSWGNFVWVDFCSSEFPRLTDEEIAELLFFAHMGRPLRRISLPTLQNKFLSYAHDDGWYLRLYYSDWRPVQTWLAQAVPILTQQHLAALEQGADGFWIRDGCITKEEKTDDVDRVLNRRL